MRRGDYIERVDASGLLPSTPHGGPRASAITRYLASAASLYITLFGGSERFNVKGNKPGRAARALHG